MKQEYINTVMELIEEAEKLDRFGWTHIQFKECKNAVEDALERQILRKCINEGEYMCPYCKIPLGEDDNHCFECGQAISWGEES